MNRIDPDRTPRTSLRGAWWIAALVGMFFVAVAVLQIGEVMKSRQAPRVGDGSDPTTYGYDLGALTVDVRWLAATMPKDNLESLDTPALLVSAQVDSLNRAERGKYLVSEDRVIGVVIGACLFLICNLVVGDQRLAWVLFLSMLIVIALAAAVGTGIPLLLHRFGVDPAVATGPFITTANDIFGLLIYLGLATLILELGAVVGS